MRTFLLASTLLVNAAMPLQAQELPDAQNLSSRLDLSLQNYWKIEEFRLIAAIKQGDPITPQALIRFEADISPAQDLFLPQGERMGPFITVIPTIADSTVRTLYGTMTLNYQSGNWTGEPVIENPVANLGQPHSMFSAPTMVLGSDEQKALLQTLHDDAIAVANALLIEERQVLATQHTALIANAERLLQEQLRDLNAIYGPLIAAEEHKFSTDLAQLGNEHAATLTAQENTLAAQSAALEAELNEATAAYQTQISALEHRLAAETAQIRGENAALIAEEQSSHAAQTAALNAVYAEDFAELEAGLTARRDRLTRQLSEAETIVSKQNELVLLLQAAALNEQELTELRNAALARQRVLFESFGSTVSGSIHCESTETDEVLDLSMSLVVDEAGSTGLRGTININHVNYAANMTVIGETADLQKLIRFSIDYDYIPGVYDLVLGENGQMVGVASGNAAIQNTYRFSVCEAAFGAG